MNPDGLPWVSEFSTPTGDDAEGTTRLPRTSRLAVVAAVVAGTAGLATGRPLVVAPFVAGLFLGVGIVGLRGSSRRVAFASMALPVGLVCVVGTVVFLLSDASLSGGLPVVPYGDGVSPYAGASAVVAAVLGVTLVEAGTDGLSDAAISRASAVALLGAGLGTVLAGPAYWLSETVASDSLTALAFVTGDGLSGLALLLVLAAAAVVGAVYAIPPGVVTSPDRRPRYFDQRRRGTLLVAVLTAATLAALGLFGLVGPSGPVSTAADVLLRVPLLAVVAVSLPVAGFAIALRVAWQHVRGGRDDSAAVILGTSIALVGLFGVVTALGAPPVALFVVPFVLAVAGIALRLLWAVVSAFGVGTPGRELFPVAALGSLVAGVLVTGVERGEVTTFGLPELGLVVALAAGLFAYRVGTYAGGVSREVGAGTARPLPQLAHVAYAATVVTVGAVVVGAGYVVAVLVAPVTSVSATVGVAGALAASVLLVRFLLE